MPKSNDVIIDSYQPFSKSLFWNAQHEFYHEQGINAWTGEVPFYITSNPFIANSYAELILRFIQDWLHKDPRNIEAPFYVVELGSGPGQFSFYTLKALSRLLKKFNLTRVKLRYIMTDFTESNLHFWQQQKQLKPFVKKGLLDFALFNLENDETIKSITHGYLLNKASEKNPLIVIANYLFDSIKTDIFCIKNKKIHESLVQLSSSKDNIINSTPKSWKKVKINHQEKPIAHTYYQDKQLDNTLNHYAKKMEDGTYLLFPIGTLRALNRLKAISQDQLLLISSDKGYTNLHELNDAEYPELDFHGSFSLMVNYHAIAHHAKQFDGQSFLSSPRDGAIVTGVFSYGFTLEDLPETHYQLEKSVEGFSPTDFYNYYELIDKAHKKTDLKTMASTLCLSLWDPFLFEIMSQRINELFETEDTEIIDYIIANIPNIVDNFYFIPSCEDIFFSIALLFYTIDHYDEAIHYYKLSLRYFKANFENVYNLALSHYYNENYPEALDCFQQALEFKPKNAELKRLMRSCKAKA